jgi:hypothetical protein
LYPFLYSTIAYQICIDYDDVKCIAYACPPIFDYALATAEETKQLIINVIHNNDCVPRISFNSLLVLKTQVVYLLNEFIQYHNKHPEIPAPRKWKMIFDLAVQKVEPNSPSMADYKKFFMNPDLNQGLQNALKAVENPESRCYLPGRNFYVEALTPFEQCCDCFGVTPPTIREADCKEFLEFPVRNNMFMNHMPWEYNSVLNALSATIRHRLTTHQLGVRSS